MTFDDAMTRLNALADPARAAEMLAYHKAPRPYLGIALPDLDPILADARPAPLDERVKTARALWDTNIHEARILAAKLLTQARLTPDLPVWELFCAWAPTFDAWAIADHACKAGERRLIADPSRIDHIEAWITDSNMWVRRAALVVTLPWTKQNHPKAKDLEIRDRVLSWAATLAPDRDWFIQKAVAWWLRELSKHDPDRTRAFLAQHGATLKPFARKEASRLLPTE